MADRRTRHGLNAAMTRIKLRGLDAIDRRTGPARALLQWREQVISDCGGLESLSATKLALIDAACRTRALLDHADAFLVGESSIVNKRRKAFIPLVAQRQTLCDSLARLLGQLGLSRVPKPVKSLADHLRDMEAEKAATAAGPTPETGVGDAVFEPEEIRTKAL